MRLSASASRSVRPSPSQSTKLTVPFTGWPDAVTSSPRSAKGKRPPGRGTVSQRGARVRGGRRQKGSEQVQVPIALPVREGRRHPTSIGVVVREDQQRSTRAEAPSVEEPVATAVLQDVEDGSGPALDEVEVPVAIEVGEAVVG